MICRLLRWLRDWWAPPTHPDWEADDPFRPGTVEPGPHDFTDEAWR